MFRAVERNGPAIISGIILITLSLQVAAVVIRADKSWPFQHYPMYSPHHSENERVQVELSVFATLADGTDRRLDWRELGIPIFVFLRQFTRPILQDDREKVLKTIAPLRTRVGQEIVSVRVEDYPVIVTRSGMQRAEPPQVLKTMSLK